MTVLSTCLIVSSLNIHEFSAEELEKESETHIHIKAEATDAQELLSVLKDRGISYELVSQKDKKLEEYFVSLVGGDDHA